MTYNVYFSAGDYTRQAAKAPPARPALRALTPRRPPLPRPTVASVISHGEDQRFQPAAIQVFSKGRPPAPPVTLSNVEVPNRATAVDPTGPFVNSAPNVDGLDREHASSHRPRRSRSSRRSRSRRTRLTRRSTRPNQSMRSYRSRRSRRSPQRSRSTFSCARCLGQPRLARCSTRQLADSTTATASVSTTSKCHGHH